MENSYLHGLEFALLLIVSSAWRCRPDLLPACSHRSELASFWSGLQSQHARLDCLCLPHQQPWQAARLLPVPSWLCLHLLLRKCGASLLKECGPGQFLIDDGNCYDCDIECDHCYGQHMSVSTAARIFWYMMRVKASASASTNSNNALKYQEPGIWVSLSHLFSLPWWVQSLHSSRATPICILR